MGEKERGRGDRGWEETGRGEDREMEGEERRGWKGKEEKGGKGTFASSLIELWMRPCIPLFFGYR